MFQGSCRQNVAWDEGGTTSKFHTFCIIRPFIKLVFTYFQETNITLGLLFTSLVSALSFIIPPNPPTEILTEEKKKKENTYTLIISRFMFFTFQQIFPDFYFKKKTFFTKWVLKKKTNRILKNWEISVPPRSWRRRRERETER